MGSPRSVRDSLSFSAPTAFAGVLAFLAGLLPAVRASRMDPVVALRHE